jgi:hypothetical protein
MKLTLQSQVVKYIYQTLSRSLLTLSIIWMLASGSSIAQGLPGYVVLPAGDTLRGYIAESNTQRIAYYSRPGAEPQYYYPTQARGYGLSKSIAYASRTVRLKSGKDSLRFAHPLLLGPASLYGTSSDSTKLLLQPPASDTLYELTSVNWHLLFSRYLGSCKSLDMTDRQVLQMPFEVRWVNNLIMRYNQCVEPNWKAKRVKSSTGQFSFGINAGLNYSYLASGEGSDVAEQHLQPGASLGLELQTLRSSGWWISSGLVFQQLRGGYKPFSVNTGTSLFSDMRSRDYTMNSLLLQGRLGRSIGQPSRIRPFVYASAAGGYTLSSHSIVRDKYTNSFYPDKEVRTDESSKFNVQIGGGVGMWVPISPRQDIQVSLQYTQFTMLSVPSTLRNRIATLQLGYKLASL